MHVVGKRNQLNYSKGMALGNAKYETLYGVSQDIQ